MAAQRSSYSQGEFRDIVRGDVGLRANKLLTDDEINRWGRRAQRLFAQHTGWYYRDNQALPITAGTHLYDFPADAIAIREIRHAGLPLLLTTAHELEAGNPYWRNVGNGTPRRWFRRGMTSFGLHQTPGTTSLTDLTLDYVAIPPNPTGDSDFYYVPVALDEAYLAYGKMRGAEKDGTGEGRDRMQVYRAEWFDYLRQGKALVEESAQGELVVWGGDADTDDRLWGMVFVAPAPP